MHSSWWGEAPTSRAGVYTLRLARTLAPPVHASNAPPNVGPGCPMAADPISPNLRSLRICGSLSTLLFPVGALCTASRFLVAMRDREDMIPFHETDPLHYPAALRARPHLGHSHACHR